MLWVKPDDNVREHALCGDLNDIARVVGSVKVACGRKGMVTEYGELGPRIFEETLRQCA